MGQTLGFCRIPIQFVNPLRQTSLRAFLGGERGRGLTQFRQCVSSGATPRRPHATRARGARQHLPHNAAQGIGGCPNTAHLGSWAASATQLLFTSTTMSFTRDRVLRRFQVRSAPRRCVLNFVTPAGRGITPCGRRPCGGGPWRGCAAAARLGVGEGMRCSRRARRRRRSRLDTPSARWRVRHRGIDGRSAHRSRFVRSSTGLRRYRIIAAICPWSWLWGPIDSAAPRL